MGFTVVPGVVGSRGWDADRGDGGKDPAPARGAGQVDQGDLPRARDLAEVVRKVLRSGETEFRYSRARQPQPKLGPWQAELERLLEANEARPRRERLTLVRVYEALLGLGYEGGYDAVRRHARGWQASRSTAVAAAFVPLSFAPGEAYQFDWSHEVVLIGGTTVTVKVAHVGLCHSCRATWNDPPRAT